MPTPVPAVKSAIAWGSLVSVCVGPFLFGAVEQGIWMPLSGLWMVLGLVSSLVQKWGAEEDADSAIEVSRALLPLHVVFLLQLLPLPAVLLRTISPGSYAAHFLPDPGDGRLGAISVSPGSTLEAWLYVAGLHGLFLAVHGLPKPGRRGVIHAILWVSILLAGEGLWQSRTAEPFLLYGRVPIFAPSGLDSATFGPYFNRNHFAAVMAMAAAIATGLLTGLVAEAGGLRQLLTHANALAQAVPLGGAAAILVLTSAASGSRSGTIAALGAIAFLLLRAFGKRISIAALGLGASLVAISGASSFERLTRLDLLASRWQPWQDMTTLLRFFPAFGAGIGAFGSAYWPYQTNAAYEFWEHAHNEYLEWLIEAGLLGLVALFLVIRSLRRTVQMDPFAREAAIGALVAMGIQSGLDFPLRIPANGALLVGLLALSVQLRPFTTADPR